MIYCQWGEALKRCQCCGQLTLDADSIFDICDYCGWQHEPIYDDGYPIDEVAGANRISLKDARACYEQEVFGELRSIVHSQRGEARWKALTTLLKYWSQEQLRQVVLPYLSGALKEDPYLREAPEGWFIFKRGQLSLHPAWPLVQSL